MREEIFGIDAWFDSYFRKFGERRLLTSDFEECGEELIKLINNARSKIQLYLTKMPSHLFIYDSKELKTALNDASSRGIEVKVLNGNRNIHFCVADEKHVFFEEPYRKGKAFQQVLIEYNTKILGKRWSQRFEEAYNKTKNKLLEKA